MTLPLDGTNYDFDVIGFNHDELTTPTAYGAATATGKAGITFQMHDLFATGFKINDSDTNAGGWENCTMRTSTMATLRGYLPSIWQTAIKPVNKLSGVGGGTSSGTKIVSDNCFLLAEVEIIGSVKNSVAGEGTQYAYYKAGNSPRKGQIGYASKRWWTRSPYSRDNNFFVFINENGSVNGGSGSMYGVPFAFCV